MDGMPRSVVTVLFLAILLAGNVSFGFDFRPCGPDSIQGPLRKLIPQGAAGVDFRPACVVHDRCYGTYGSDKAQCDRKFRADMLSRCENSKHPILCKRRARQFYRATALLGGGAFESAQERAKMRLLQDRG